MLSLMTDSAHDKFHVYRVLYAAVDIAKHEKNVDIDVMLAACLLHDIGREAQYRDDTLCHAKVGSEMAYDFLLSTGWNGEKAAHVRECISSHRYRGDNPPVSLEAKILFDADKLDAAGAMGIARTLVYNGITNAPIYVLDDGGNVLTEANDDDITPFMQEYNYKLKKVYSSFHTDRAKTIAATRQKTAESFYNNLYSEVADNYETGVNGLNELLGE